MAPLEPGALTGLVGPWALVNGRVWDGSGALHDAISFRSDGRIGGCGSVEEVLTLLPAGADIVDGRGAFVSPGFVDPHVHVRAAASACLALDVSNARGPVAVLAAVHDACADDRGWATFVGLRDEPVPHRRELDVVSGRTNVRIRDRRGHGWLLNSSGLAALGIDALGTTDAAPAGVLVARGEDHTPTGFVTDHIGWVGRVLGRISESAALSRAVADWSRDLATHGIVAVCDATLTNDMPQVDALLEWRRTGALVQEVTALVDPDAAEEATTTPQVCGLKFGNAHDRRLLGALRAGVPVAVHCVDPTELGTILDAVRLVPNHGPVRLEHASFVPPDWLPDVKRTGATVVTQPSFVEAYGDHYLADPALEPHDWLYRLSSWKRAGVPLAFGSDAPFGPAEPLRALRAAALRRTARGRSLGADEALTGNGALRAATATAADCSGHSQRGYGRLAAGGPGAAVVLSGDVRSDSEATIVATVIGGTVVG